MLWNTSFAPKIYIKNLCHWMVLLFLCISQAVLADNTGFIEVRADHVVLYPQRMELRDEETLKDVLEMYPELLVGGYSDVLMLTEEKVEQVKDVRKMCTIAHCYFSFAVKTKITI